MAEPIKHHLASGIHPGAFVQPDVPSTADVQDGVLWIDTSSGPPHQLKRWNATAATWQPVQMDATGYPLPGGHRVEEYRVGALPDPLDPPVLAAATRGSACGVPAGTYWLVYTLGDGTKETLPSPAAAVTTASGQWIDARVPSTLDAGTLPSSVWIKFYVVAPLPTGGLYPGFVDEHYYQAIADNLYAVTHICTALDHSRPLPPSSNNTGTLMFRVVDPTNTPLLTQDRITFDVYSDDVPVLETPFPLLATPPEQILGKDPADGLPKWSDVAFLARKAELPTDTGGLGELPAPDRALPDDPPAPTMLQTDKLIPPVALPDEIIDNCPIMRCGAAYYLAQKLKEQYDIVRTCLLGMLAAPLLLRIPAATAPFGITILDLLIARLSDSLIGQFGADILWLTRIVTKLNRWLKVIGAGISVATDFEDIGEEGITILQRLAYHSLTCSENIFNLSQDMLIAWELSINADTADFTDWQRHLLVYILQCTPFGIYHTVAAQGAAITSDTCGGF